MTKDFREILGNGGCIIPGKEGCDEYIDSIARCYIKLQKYNSSVMTADEMHDAISDILGKEVDESTRVIFPVRCDLGTNIELGRNVLINYNCTFVDTVNITIGDNTMLGPDCHIVTAVHPLDPIERTDHRVMGKPVKIGKDCWLGANVTVLPGVTIGDGCTVGAGSVVTKDVPDGITVVGNPARPIVRHD